jgi:hypothetical protein
MGRLLRMAGDFRAQETESGRGYNSPACSNFELQNIWTRENMQAPSSRSEYSTRDLQQQNPRSLGESSGIIARGADGFTLFNDSQLVAQRTPEVLPPVFSTTPPLAELVGTSSEHHVTAQNWKQIRRQAVKAIGRVSKAAQHAEFAYVETPSQGGDWIYPRRGREDKFISHEGAAAAMNTLPQLRQLDPEVGPPAINRNLIAAIVRNEQYYYDNRKDPGPDEYVRQHHNWPFEQDESLGPAQIQARNISRLAHEYPQQLGDPKTAIARAEDPYWAAKFAGAYLNEVIQHIKEGTRPDYIGSKDWQTVTTLWREGQRDEALITAYNPDPHQIEHVNKQLRVIDRQLQKQSN